MSNMGEPKRFEKQITFWGQEARVACDGQCHKAWGIQQRPRVMLGNEDDPDDYYYIPDQELDEAPIYPGTYEGGQGKPRSPENYHNRWCVRECERSVMTEPGHPNEELLLPDFSQRRYNKKSSEGQG